MYAIPNNNLRIQIFRNDSSYIKILNEFFTVENYIKDDQQELKKGFNIIERLKLRMSNDIFLEFFSLRNP